MKRIHSESVLEVLEERAPRALPLGEIAARLGIPKSKTEQLSKMLDRLAERGKVREMPGRRYRFEEKAPPRRSQPSGGTQSSRGGALPPPRITGRIMMSPRGFGFVPANDGGPDIFIPHPHLGPALHGDLVEVEVFPSEKGREGSVRVIRERRPRRITGSVRFVAGRPLFEPDDLRIRSPLEIEGKLPKNLKPDEVLVAEITRFPQHRDDDAAVQILEVLGIQGLTEIETKKIEIRENIVEEFPESVLAEAARLGESVSPSEKKDRLDLRDLDFVTIDPPDARDCDDALYIERLAGGELRLVVAIADVAYYVDEGGAMDAEALERGNSIYLPTRAIPMLPPSLSSGLASLMPRKDRLAMVVDIRLNRRGLVRDATIHEAVIRARAKLTYEGVARALGLTKEGPAERGASARRPMLELLHELAKSLRARRLKRGALDFDLPEPQIVFDESGVEPIDIVRSRKDPGVREAYRIVEEMMLITNETVAKIVKERKLPSIYRVHGTPDRAKLEVFSRLAASLGYELAAEDAEDPKKLGRFLTAIEGEAMAPTLRYLLLRSMQQASYQTSPDIGHFGLASKDYLHFTAPIRRYSDLTVHRIIRAMLQKKRLDEAVLLPRLELISAETSRLERRAMLVERDIVDLYRVIIMRDRIGEIFEGRVSGVEHYGIYVECDEPFVDLFIPVETLGEDRFEVDSLGIRLVGERSGFSFTLGDRVRVELREASIRDRKLRGILARPEDESEDEGELPRSRKRRAEAGDGRRAPTRKKGGGETRSRDTKRGSGQVKEQVKGQVKGERRQPKRPRRTHSKG